jgi:hypothetical protein
MLVWERCARVCCFATRVVWVLACFAYTQESVALYSRLHLSIDTVMTAQKYGMHASKSFAAKHMECIKAHIIGTHAYKSSELSSLSCERTVLRCFRISITCSKAGRCCATIKKCVSWNIMDLVPCVNREISTASEKQSA